MSACLRAVSFLAELAAGRDGRGRAATLGGGRRRLAAFLRQTLRSSLAEDHVLVFAGRFHLDDRILRDDATIGFDFDLQLIVRQDAFTKLEDFRETVGAE